MKAKQRGLRVSLQVCQSDLGCDHNQAVKMIAFYHKQRQIACEPTVEALSIDATTCSGCHVSPLSNERRMTRSHQLLSSLCATFSPWKRHSRVSLALSTHAGPP